MKKPTKPGTVIVPSAAPKTTTTPALGPGATNVLQMPTSKSAKSPVGRLLAEKALKGDQPPAAAGAVADKPVIFAASDLLVSEEEKRILERTRNAFNGVLSGRVVISISTRTRVTDTGRVGPDRTAVKWIEAATREAARRGITYDPVFLNCVGASLNGVTALSAVLVGDFHGADFRGADLSGATLIGDFSDADFSAVHFMGDAFLEGDFTGALFSAVRFSDKLTFTSKCRAGIREWPGAGGLADAG